MNRKQCMKFIYGILFGTVGALVLCALFVVFTDPFHQYRKRGDGEYLSKAVYETAGAARNFDYRDVIVGSSMTENFRASDADALLGWDTLKLSYSGLWTDDMQAVLTQIFDTHEPEHVLMSVDMYMFMDTPEQVKSRVYAPRPEYLYTKSILDDAPYLWNLDVLREGVRKLYGEVRGTTPSADLSYTWGHPTGKNAVVTPYLSDRETYLKREAEELKADYYIESTKVGLSAIEPFFTEHPETEFIVFFPVYSMLYWDEQNILKRTDAVIAAQEYLINAFLSHDNVRVFYFMTDEVSEDLDHYVDTCHHDASVNHDELAYIAEGRYELFKDTYEAVLESMRLKAHGFDYDQYF